MKYEIPQNCKILFVEFVSYPKLSDVFQTSSGSCPILLNINVVSNEIFSDFFCTYIYLYMCFNSKDPSKLQPLIYHSLFYDIVYNITIKSQRRYRILKSTLFCHQYSFFDSNSGQFHLI